MCGCVACVIGKAGAVRPMLSTLTIGQFTFEPPEGTIQPGGRVEVAVTFKADGNTGYTEALGVQIDQRDFADCPLGIPYEVAGESCIPGESHMCGILSCTCLLILLLLVLPVTEPVPRTW